MTDMRDARTAMHADKTMHDIEDEVMDPALQETKPNTADNLGVGEMDLGLSGVELDNEGTGRVVNLDEFGTNTGSGAA